MNLIIIYESIQVTVYNLCCYREWNRKCSEVQDLGVEPLTKKRKLEGMKLFLSLVLFSF